MGFKQIKKWSLEQKQQWTMEHFDEVAAWVEGKIKNEYWSLGRAVSLLMGKDMVRNYATWEKKYLRKWTSGERSGMVGW